MPDDGWKTVCAFGHDEQEKLILYQRKVIAETQEQLAAETERRESLQREFRFVDASLLQTVESLAAERERREKAIELVKTWERRFREEEQRADAAEAEVAERDARREKAEAHVATLLRREMQEWPKSPVFGTYVELKHGPSGAVLTALQEGAITRSKAAEALAEIAHGAESVQLPEIDGSVFTEDETPAEVVRSLKQRAEAAEAGYRMANHSISEIAAELLRTTQRAEAAEALVGECLKLMKPITGRTLSPPYGACRAIAEFVERNNA